MQHATGPLPNHWGRGVGAANEGGGNGRLVPIQSMRGFAKQGAAQGIQADQLAPKGHEVEVGLQDVIFAPAALQAGGGHGLAQFLPQAAPPGGVAPVFIQQAGQLHGDGAGPACFLVPQIAPGGGRDGLPIDPAVLVKALVLTGQQGQAQRGRHLA